MKLPMGTDGGTITNPHETGLTQYLMIVRGAIEITTSYGNGFIITEDGELMAAYYENPDGIFKGKSALNHISMETITSSDDVQRLHIRKYSAEEFSQLLDMCSKEELLLTQEKGSGHLSHTRALDLLDESILIKVMSLPGVIAVSAFFEGFPVKSIGDADFEHVAALAEDLIRVGIKIAEEMRGGHLDQLMLETAKNKLIIAPFKDLYLVAFTKPDAQLGLIRVILKSLQTESAV